MANKRANRKSRKLRKSRKTRKIYRKTRHNRKGLAYRKRRTNRKQRTNRNRRMRGGSYLESLSRPFFASVYPNTTQNLYGAWTGQIPQYPAPSPAEVPTWSYTGAGIGQSLNPNMITPINSAFTLMAGSAPYSPTPLTTPGAGTPAGTANTTGGTSPASAAAAMASAAAPQNSIAASMAAGQQSLRTYR